MGRARVTLANSPGSYAAETVSKCRFAALFCGLPHGSFRGCYRPCPCSGRARSGKGRALTMPKGSLGDSSSESRGRGLMRGHLTGIRAAVLAAAVLTGLLFVGSAFGVTVTGFTPNSGLPAKDNGEACPGNTITINGSGFVSDNPAVTVGSPQATVTVLFGGVKSTYVVVGSNTTMYAVVPDGAKDGPLTVTTGAGSATTTANFYVNPCPQVSLAKAQADPNAVKGFVSTPTIYKFKPAKGKVGTKVTITGTNMLAVTAVYFGSTKAKFTADGVTQITATVPKGAKTGKIAVLYSISASTSQNP